MGLPHQLVQRTPESFVGAGYSGLVDFSGFRIQTGKLADNRTGLAAAESNQPICCKKSGCFLLSGPLQRGQDMQQLILRGLVGTHGQLQLAAGMG